MHSWHFNAGLENVTFTVNTNPGHLELPLWRGFFNCYVRARITDDRQTPDIMRLPSIFAFLRGEFTKRNNGTGCIVNVAYLSSADWLLLVRRSRISVFGKFSPSLRYAPSLHSSVEMDECGYSLFVFVGGFDGFRVVPVVFVHVAGITKNQ